MSKILSEEALADYADFPAVLERYPVSKATIIRAVNDGRFPTPTKANGKVRWFKVDLDSYDADNARTAIAR
jgi:predicted DNA-binding transcriptional regulator AlpA